MEKAKISVIQLFSIMFIFDMGTALVISYGIGAQKDAWLAILLGMCGGVVLFFIYYTLLRQYPNLMFTNMRGKYLENTLVDDWITLRCILVIRC
ncbi:GerAB/ArcD/ProY family transporter [uncultured Metabacillus sp.]|uniref:GerAB/ArcD/ProY family transporter n=1 Tax=uncultured Metabacillus sp. TaxID=2860135 RepID=UPI002607056C|nr:GerAB/ArcD/ProY family transporter [uncultured Metabacillus sp.]